MHNDNNNDNNTNPGGERRFAETEMQWSVKARRHEPLPALPLGPIYVAADGAKTTDPGGDRRFAELQWSVNLWPMMGQGLSFKFPTED